MKCAQTKGRRASLLLFGKIRRDNGKCVYYCHHSIPKEWYFFSTSKSKNEIMFFSLQIPPFLDEWEMPLGRRDACLSSLPSSLFHPSKQGMFSSLRTFPSLSPSFIPQIVWEFLVGYGTAQLQFMQDKYQLDKYIHTYSTHTCVYIYTKEACTN